MMLADITVAQTREAGMLLCFGVAWPVDILKTLRTRQTAGKSVGFMLIVFLGYLSGMAAKFYRAGAGEPFEAVTWLYALNAVLVAVDILVYLRYRPRPKTAL